MKFETPLLPGRLQRRYMRFLSDITLDTGDVIKAHCPNPGSMMGLKAPGSRVWVSESDNPKRKLKYTFELIEADDTMVGINTGHPNALVHEAVTDGTITELQGYATARREVKYGKNSRIDLLLEDPDKGRCYVEVKNVHLRREPELMEFPDSVTSRGAKHLGELADMVAEGHRAVMVFLVQRDDGSRFRLARDIDPAYGEAFDRAAAAGVEMLAYSCRVSADEIRAYRSIPIDDLPSR
ncbi:MAG: DNA/RNA nuclease SfsA [Pseudomonadota bacterium]